MTEYWKALARRRTSIAALTVLTATLSLLLFKPEDVFAGVVAISTVAYVVLTGRLVEETRAMRLAEREPQLSIYAEPSPRAFIWFDLVISNIGRGPAHAVQLSVVGEDWEIEKGEPLSRTGPFKHGIAYLPPGQTIRFLLGSGPEIYKGTRHSFEVNATYRDAAGIVKSEVFTVGFSHFWDWTKFAGEPIEDAAKALKKIADVVDRMGHSRGRLVVELLTQEDLAYEEEGWREARAKMLAASAPKIGGPGEVISPTGPLGESQPGESHPSSDSVD